MTTAPPFHSILTGLQLHGILVGLQALADGRTEAPEVQAVSLLLDSRPSGADVQALAGRVLLEAALVGSQPVARTLAGLVRLRLGGPSCSSEALQDPAHLLALAVLRAGTLEDLAEAFALRAPAEVLA